MDASHPAISPQPIAPEAASQESLAAFLAQPDPRRLPPVGTLRAHGVAPYAYTVLDRSHPARSELARDFRHATVRHVAIRAKLAELVRAWRDAGIETLVFKGFYLAEFVYDIPARRPYGDVDALIRPEDAIEASRVAQELGWRETWSAGREPTMYARRSQARSERYAGHEIINLDAPALGLRLDVHRRVAHNEFGRVGAQERITTQAWRAAQVVAWEGTHLHIPQPTDALLIGLVLNRAWGRDEWRLKATDLLDFRALTGAFGLTRRDLERRAGELGCRRTLQVFLRRCDGFVSNVDLDPPSFWQRLRWGFAILPERGHPTLELVTVRALDEALRALELAREVPSVIRALRAPEHAAAEARRAGMPVSGRRKEPLSYHRWERLKRAVKRGLVLFGGRSGLDLRRYALALAFALRRRGFDACVRSDDEDGDGSAGFRLEIDGNPLHIGDPALPDP